MIRRAMFIIFVFTLAQATGRAQIPQTLSYQGILKDPSGNVVSDGSYSLTFNLYDVETGGTSLWTETNSSVAVDDGLFNVILGSVTALNLNFDKQYWLGLTVGSDTELSPRIKLTASPYSLNARAVLGNSSTSNTFPDSGKAGIGTTSPTGKLMIQTAGSASTVEDALRLHYPNYTGGSLSGPRLDFSALNNAFALKDYATITALIQSNAAGAEGGHLTFGTIKSGTLTEQVRIDNSGNVGIGTTNPSTTLDVSGTFKVSGATTLNGVAYTWPSADGTSGQLLSTDAAGTLSWSTAGGTTSPGGSDGQVQYNDGGSFGGTSSLYYDDTNNMVGIGTTSPNYKLDISGGHIRFSNQYGLYSDRAAGGAQGNLISVSSADIVRIGESTLWGAVTLGPGGLEKMRVNSAGNVGIGTTSPSYKLHIVDNANTTGMFIDKSAGSNQYAIYAKNTAANGRGGLFQATGTSGNKYGVTGMTSGGGTNYGGYFDAEGGTTNYAIYANRGNAIFGATSGNVGIGTSSPEGLFSFSAAESNTVPKIRFQNSAGTSADAAISTYDDANGTYLYIGSNSYLDAGADAQRFNTSEESSAMHLTYIGTVRFLTGGTGANALTRMIINSSGNVGIGTTSPQSHLHIDNAMDAVQAGASNLSLLVRYNTITSGAGPGIGFSSDNTSSVGAKIVHIRTSSNSKGDLAFYTKSTTSGNPTEKLRIKDSGNVGIGTTSPSTILSVIQNSSTDPIADAWTVYSSRRWKTNIHPITDALERVKRLRGVSFDWKADGKQDIGLVAEEVGEVVPEVVAYEENGEDAKSVDYARLVAVLIEAVKEQQIIIDNQQDKIDDLVKRVTIIEEKTELTFK